MKERPILFSAPMVRAILEGRKTQTRRILKQPRRKDGAKLLPDLLRSMGVGKACPLGAIGDLLYVKEAAWMWCERRPNGTTKTGRPKWHYVPLESAPVLYCADHPEKPGTSVVSPNTGNEWGWRKKLGRFLPKWAARIWLEVTGVRVERLHDISEEDAKAEGISCVQFRPDDGFPVCNGYMVGKDDGKTPLAVSARDAFAGLWRIINGAESWDANPWVWVVSFKCAERKAVSP